MRRPQEHENAKNIIQAHVHIPVANEIASGLLAKMSAVSQTPQTKQKKNNSTATDR